MTEHDEEHERFERENANMYSTKEHPVKQTREGYYHWLYSRFRIWYGPVKGHEMAKAKADEWKES
jgi:hypothetical protein